MSEKSAEICYMPGCGKRSNGRVQTRHEQIVLKESKHLNIEFIPLCKGHMAEFEKTGPAFFDQFWRRES